MKTGKVSFFQLRLKKETLKNKLIIGNVARWHPYKNHILLLNSLSILNTRLDTRLDNRLNNKLD